MMTITATLNSDPSQFVRFTWSENLEELTFLACGHIADSRLEELLEADVHEGGNLDGWTVTLG